MTARRHTTQQGAVPTKTSKLAGTASLIAAALWLTAALPASMSPYVHTEWLPLFLVFAALVNIGGVLTVVATVGLRKRFGGLGMFGSIGLVILGIGVAITFVLSWAVPLWMTVQGLGMLFVALAVLRRGAAPRAATVGFGVGHSVGVAGALVINGLKVGRPDQFGLYPAAGVGTAAGFVIVAVGLGWIGVWVRREATETSDPPSPHH